MQQQKRTLTLERVLGTTTVRNASLAIRPSTGEITYAAGNVVVLYSPKRNKQVRFYRTGKAISCLCFSRDGAYLAVGERGHQPSVIVWEIDSGHLCANLAGHRLGVEGLAFSANGDWLVSVGTHAVIIFNARTGSTLATREIQQKVHAVDFSEDGRYFVTAGEQHITFWDFGDLESTLLDAEGGADAKAEGLIQSHDAVLATHKTTTFVDVACGLGEHCESVFAVTSDGMLCQLGADHLMKHWVDLEAGSAFSISVSSNHIAVGCEQGVLRLFDPRTLRYISTLPCPPAANTLGINTLCARLNAEAGQVVAFYSDCSIFVWNIEDEQKARKYRSFLHHSACIWDLQILPKSDSPEPTDLPENTFVTASADGTVRFWNLGYGKGSHRKASNPAWHNEYSQDMIHVLHMDAADDGDAGEERELPAKRGCSEVRSLALRKDAAQLACGDKSGTLRVYDLPSMACAFSQAAHDTEIMTLDYSNQKLCSARQSKGATKGPLLASGGRDRLVHVFDVSQGYKLQQTLFHHSAAVTALKFSIDGGKLFSCSGDSTLVLSEVTENSVCLLKSCATNGVVYDIDTDATNTYIITAGQDKQLNIWSTTNGKHVRSYTSEDYSSELYKAQLDPSGLYIAVAGFDKWIRLFDFFSGECLAKVAGHSELVTGIKFSSDGRRLISIGGDGCIFVWRIRSDLTQNIHNRLAEMAQEMTQEMAQEMAQETVQEHADQHIEDSPESTTAQGNDQGPERAGPIMEEAKDALDAAGQMQVVDPPAELSADWVDSAPGVQDAAFSHAGAMAPTKQGQPNSPDPNNNSPGLWSAHGVHQEATNVRPTVLPTEPQDPQIDDTALRSSLSRSFFQRSTKAEVTESPTHRHSANTEASDVDAAGAVGVAGGVVATEAVTAAAEEEEECEDEDEDEDEEKEEEKEAAAAAEAAAADREAVEEAVVEANAAATAKGGAAVAVAAAAAAAAAAAVVTGAATEGTSMVATDKDKEECEGVDTTADTTAETTAVPGTKAIAVVEVAPSDAGCSGSDAGCSESAIGSENADASTSPSPQLRASTQASPEDQPVITFPPVRTLQQERESMRLRQRAKETENVVENMRAQLRDLGILKDNTNTSTAATRPDTANASMSDTAFSEAGPNATRVETKREETRFDERMNKTRFDERMNKTRFGRLRTSRASKKPFGSMPSLMGESMEGGSMEGESMDHMPESPAAVCVPATPPSVPATPPRPPSMPTALDSSLCFSAPLPAPGQPSDSADDSADSTDAAADRGGEPMDESTHSTARDTPTAATALQAAGTDAPTDSGADTVSDAMKLSISRPHMLQQSQSPRCREPARRHEPQQRSDVGNVGSRLKGSSPVAPEVWQQSLQQLHDLQTQLFQIRASMSMDGMPKELAQSVQVFDERTAWLNEMSALRISIAECSDREVRLKLKHTQRFDVLEGLLYPGGDEGGGTGGEEAASGGGGTSRTAGDQQ
jgi:WD40 repeat protein